jgi:thiol-disulfide isomerase/thioredoxin
MRRLVAAALLSVCAAAGAAAAPPLEESPRVGYLAPPFTGTDLAGKEFTLAGLKGKVVLLNFWASWCGPCLAEMPDLAKLQAALPVTDFVVVGLAQDSEVKDVTDFLKTSPVNFPIVLDDDQSVSRLYQMRGLPTSYLLDRKGMIVERMLGPREWDSKEWREKVRKLGQ